MSSAPFLRWAGGKRWLFPYIRQIATGSFERYVEPFLGSGAIFFQLSPSKSLLTDLNPWLIETFQAVKDTPDTVLRELRSHHRRHSEAHYYTVRGKTYSTAAERAAQLIYLNRTCWNALYRVNSEGFFNVPKGTKERVLYAEDNFQSWSMKLKNAEMRSADFGYAFANSRRGDFIFADPPYVTTHSQNGFLKYNEKIFSWDDQIRLADLSYLAADRGVTVLVSNAPHDSVLRLYQERGAVITLIERSSKIAASSQHRKKVHEMLGSFSVARK